jgi:hypothetical protein
MKKNFLAVSLFSFFFLMGCSKDYVQICKDIYEEINNLSCIKTNEKFNIEEMCPESYNSGDYNYDKFFECVKKSRTCDENGEFIDNIGDCVAK